MMFAYGFYSLSSVCRAIAGTSLRCRQLVLVSIFISGGGAIDKNFIFHRMRETRKLTKMEMIPMIDDLTGGKLHLGQPGLYVMLMLFLYQCSGIKLLVSASYLPLK
jgi:hypothetical protein